MCVNGSLKMTEVPELGDSASIYYTLLPITRLDAPSISPSPSLYLISLRDHHHGIIIIGRGHLHGRYAGHMIGIWAPAPSTLSGSARTRGPHGSVRPDGRGRVPRKMTHVAAWIGSSHVTAMIMWTRQKNLDREVQMEVGDPAAEETAS